MPAETSKSFLLLFFKKEVLLLFLALCRPALAAEKVAIADFDFVDSSGEVRDQTAAHAARLKELRETIAASLNRTGRFTTVGLSCASPPCSADNLDAGTLTDAARHTGASLLVFGGVHKISTLITFGRVAVVDLRAATTSLLNRDITFRGDDEDAWRHFDAYVSDMIVEAASLKK